MFFAFNYELVFMNSKTVYRKIGLDRPLSYEAIRQVLYDAARRMDLNFHMEGSDKKTVRPHSRGKDPADFIDGHAKKYGAIVNFRVIKSVSPLHRIEDKPDYGEVEISGPAISGIAGRRRDYVENFVAEFRSALGRAEPGRTAFTYSGLPAPYSSSQI
jgi:hypothetical protein